MKILFDIAHPAAVHYFKGLIKKFKAAGHAVIITARDKDVTHHLLRSYEFDFIDTGMMKKSLAAKLWFQLSGEFKAYKILAKNKPDIVVSMGSITFAHAAFLLGIPYIAFDDTEHTATNRFFYAPFASRIFTPKSYTIDLGKKQTRFNGVFELFYLHPDQIDNWKVPDLKKELVENKFAIIRFSSWEAFHDLGKNKLNYSKLDLVRSVSKRMRVFVSMEGEMPDEIKPYKLDVPPEQLHAYLRQAEIYIGEGATTASEAAILGVPSVYLNPLNMGYIVAEENWGLLWNLGSEKNVLEKLDEILSIPDLKTSTLKKINALMPELTDPCEYFYSYLLNYPESDKNLPECIG